MIGWFRRRYYSLLPPPQPAVTETEVITETKPETFVQPEISIVEAIETYEIPPLRNELIMVLARNVARHIIAKRKHAHPLISEDAYDAMRAYCTANHVVKPCRDTFLEAFRQLPNVKKRRVSTLDDEAHDFVYARMQARGRFVSRPVVYYISEEKQRVELPADRVDIAWLSEPSHVVPFEPRKKAGPRRSHKRKLKPSMRMSA